MKKINLIIVLLFTITVVSAQKKVAVFDPTDNSNTDMGEIVREVLSTGLVNAVDYVPVEREQIQQVLKENKYQASGMVDESKVSELGKQMGADYVCVSIIKKMGTNYFITAKLVDVTTSTVKLQKYVKTNNGDDDLFEKIETLSTKLFGGKSSSNATTTTTTTINNYNGNSGTFTDSRDNKQYKWVKIGTQTWMAENLAYKKSSGCWAYDNNQSNVAKYGYLYNWETAKNVCPSGWHLPTKAEFETLLNNYGNGNDNEEDWKANYTALIPSGESGFSASFGGWRIYSGYYDGIGSSGHFWSSSTKDDTYAWKFDIYSNSKVANIFNYKKSVGLSVRCLQD